MNNALRYPLIVSHQEDGWTKGAEIAPWFRRLYFDGYLSGRYELGFLILGPEENTDPNQPPVDTQRLAAAILAIPTMIHSPDGSITSQPIATCAKSLSLAYIVASTRQNCAISYPPAETINQLFFAGEPLVYVRVSSGRAIKETRDRRVVSGEDEPLLFISSSTGSSGRGNLIVQSSQSTVWKETAQERAVRVLTSHLTSAVFSCDKMTSAAGCIDRPASRDYLRRAVANAIGGLCTVPLNSGDTGDKELAFAMQAYGKAYAGKIDRLTDRLHALEIEWGKPTWAERVSSTAVAVRDSIIKAMVDKGADLLEKGPAGM